MARGGLTHYELTQPGLGFSVPYNGDGTTMTIYVYDKGLPDIPTDLNDDLIQEHFGSLLAEVKHSPLYNKADLRETYVFGRNDKELGFLCGEFSAVDTE